MWFRPEVVRTVEWAGEPDSSRDEKGLHPRNSFNAWKELVRGRSAPWSEMEIESAREFRSALMTISLKQAEEAVELSEARFQQLTQALPSPVWTASDDGQLTYVNETWLDQGFGPRGRWYDRVGLTPEEEAECGEAWEFAVGGGVAFEAELRFRTGPDRVDKWSLVRAVPFLRANHNRAGWVGTCTDLTDRRARETALRMAEKLELTGRMTSVIAHEINNPLEAITNLLYLLSMERRTDATRWIISRRRSTNWRESRASPSRRCDGRKKVCRMPRWGGLAHCLRM
jgi:PAS domain-containing protein